MFSAITYISSILFAFLAPLMLQVVGVRVTLFLSAILYTGFFIGIIFLEPWTLYLGSVIAGLNKWDI